VTAGIGRPLRYARENKLKTRWSYDRHYLSAVQAPSAKPSTLMCRTLIIRSCERGLMMPGPGYAPNPSKPAQVPA
jgi:hypothetical protein